MTPEQASFVETLYRAHFSELVKLAAHALHDPSLAQEVAQTIFYDVINQVEELMVHPNVVGWLRVTLRNKLNMLYRTQAKEMEYFRSLDTSYITEPGAMDAALEAVEQEYQEDVARVREALTPEEFRFLCRLVLDKTSHMELSREYGITVAATKKRRERILNKLHKLFPDIKDKFR